VTGVQTCALPICEMDELALFLEEHCEVEKILAN
jgi:hypothetical protein